MSSFQNIANATSNTQRLPPHFPKQGIFNDTVSSMEDDVQSAITNNRNSSKKRVKKSVTFQVYTAKNLNNIKQKREELQNQLDNFSRERSLSNTTRRENNTTKSNANLNISNNQIQNSTFSNLPQFQIQTLTSEINISNQKETMDNPLSNRSSLNQRVSVLPIEEIKENTFGIKGVNHLLAQQELTNNQQQQLNDDDYNPSYLVLSNPFSQQIKSSINSNTQNLQSHSQILSPNSNQNLQMSKLLRSGMTQALNRMEYDGQFIGNALKSTIRERQSGVKTEQFQSLNSSPTNQNQLAMSIDKLQLQHLRKSNQSYQSPPEIVCYKEKFTFQNLSQLVQSIENTVEKQNCSDIIQSFDILAEYSWRINQKILRQTARCNFYLIKRYMGHLKYAMRAIKYKRYLIEKANKFRQQKVKTFKKILWRKIRKILIIEKRWLQKVQKEFQLQQIDQMIMAWRLFVKYKKAKRNHRLTIYYYFMRRLQDKVDKRYSNISKIQDQLNRYKLKRIVQGMKSFVRYSKKKRQNLRKMLIFRSKALIRNGFENFRCNKQQQKTIKQDVLLKQAIIDKNEFFTVQVSMKSGLIDNPMNFQNKDKTTGKFNITKHNVMNINIIN
ncbi:UNKNOWN [Stylonychia lemnae]|uniref:Uncharacterized protein n=1 Tax=Stylonychia lemnae TaxID=5949 RepID=A0A077ZX07_STYLE|nr:UNKNOWN [Stylonychia lemnae]|eukprot:CDW74446.1 UNKNOWN [Stylonychia lemnae]